MPHPRTIVLPGCMEHITHGKRAGAEMNNFWHKTEWCTYRLRTNAFALWGALVVPAACLFGNTYWNG